MKYKWCDRETGAEIAVISSIVECYDALQYGDCRLIIVFDEFDISNIKCGDTYCVKVLTNYNIFSFEIYIDWMKVLSKNIVLVEGYASAGAYTFGVLSVIEHSLRTSLERPWLNMIGTKRLYISASLCYKGVRSDSLDSNIIIEGKYITDIDSFYCEIGYAFFNKLGYMGANLDGTRDCFTELSKLPRKFNITWNDSDHSRFCIQNTEQDIIYRSSIFSLICDELSDGNNLELK